VKVKQVTFDAITSTIREALVSLSFIPVALAIRITLKILNLVWNIAKAVSENLANVHEMKNFFIQTRTVYHKRTMHKRSCNKRCFRNLLRKLPLHDFNVANNFLRRRNSTT
jgi:hypothetical protein